MSTVKKLADLLKAAPSLSEIGSCPNLVVDAAGNVGKIWHETASGLSAKVTTDGSWLASDTGVYILFAFAQGSPYNEHWFGVLVNRGKNAEGRQHLIAIESKTINVEYSRWGTVTTKNATSDVTYAIIKLPSTPAIMGGGKWLTSKRLKIPLPCRLRHSVRNIPTYQLN